MFASIINHKIIISIKEKNGFLNQKNKIDHIKLKKIWKV